MPGRAVLAFDFLGFGLSEKPRDHDYTLVWQADLAEELIRREAPGEPVFIVGHDMGTSVANELMARDLSDELGFELAGVLLFNGSMIQDAASPTLGQRLLRGRLGPLAAAAQQRALLPPPVRLDLLPRASAHRRGGRRPVVADRPQRRPADRPPADPLHGRARCGYAERWHGAIRDWPGPLSLGWGMLDPVATPGVLVGAARAAPGGAGDRSWPSSATTLRSRTRSESRRP